MDTKKHIRDTFSSTLIPGSLSGVSGYAKNRNISYNKAKKLLFNIEEVQLAFERKRKAPMAAVLVHRPLQIYGFDLLDFSQWQYENRRKKFYLIGIDVFTKYSFGIALRNKSAIECAKGFELLINREKIPKGAKFFIDREKSFTSKLCQSVLKRYGISTYHNFSPRKSSVIEIKNLNVRRALEMLFSLRKTRNWIRFIDSILAKQNRTYHRTIRMTPMEAMKLKNLDTVMYNSFSQHILKLMARKPSNLKENDKVRVRSEKVLFAKAHKFDQWSRDIFTIVRKINTVPAALYEIADKYNAVLEAKFHENDLLKVSV